MARLSGSRYCPNKNGKGSLPNVLIPKKALAEILKMDGSEGATLSIRHSENHLLFSVGSRQLISRLLDVNFPDYEKILSKGNDRVALVSRTACQAAIRRVALFSSERSRGVKLTFEKNLLTIASASPELGEGTETLDVEYDAEPLSIGLNSQYLLDFLEEAHNTQLIARLVEDYELLVVPDVIHPYVTERVLTLDVSARPDLARKYGIAVVPVAVRIDGRGRVIERLAG